MIALRRRPARLVAGILATLVALLLAGCSVLGSDSPDESDHASIEGSVPGGAVPEAVGTAASSTPVPGEGPITLTLTPAFVWPAEGPITSFMGPEHPDGIDIGLDNGVPRVVYAAARGLVAEAGGTDEDTLGISVIIDHGNGITTTYGHLAELRVANGDEVETGSVIGIGGSTGVSTGDHLHFEVRKDGLTVDPLAVLPERDAAVLPTPVDCEAGYTVPAGTEAVLNLRGILGDGERIIATEVSALGPAGTLSASVGSPLAVSLASPIDLGGPNRLDLFSLNVTIDQTSGNRTLECLLAVEHKSVPTTFFVRASTEDGPVDTPTPTPTPTPPPNQPRYDTPTFDPAGGGGPDYAAPTRGAPQVSSPGYGIPGAQPTATPVP